MGNKTLPLLSFNRGRVSRLGLSRQDVKRIALSADIQTNWIPTVLGSMSIRPGLGYKGATKSNAAAKLLEFIFSVSDKAIIELTAAVMRVWVNDALVTRASVSSAVANSSFTDKTSTAVTFTGGGSADAVYTGADIFVVDDPVSFSNSGGGLPAALTAGTTYYVKSVVAGTNTITVAATSPTASASAITMATAGTGTHTIYAHAAVTSWTDNDEVGSMSAWVTGGYLGLIGTGTNAAIRDQTVTVAAGDLNVEHALRIIIQRGPVILRVGSTAGGDEYITETTLATGTHSLTFTPTGDFRIRLMNRATQQTLVDSCNVEAAGVMELPTPWTVNDLGLIRSDQSADVVFCACSGKQQRKIERRSTTSWSVVVYAPDDGPFRVINTGPGTMTAASIFGNTTLTSSIAFFRSTHVGALFALTSTGQTVSKSMVALNDATGSIEVLGVTTSRNFTIVISGLTGTGNTVDLQRSFDNAAWVAVPTYTWTTDVTTSYTDGLENQIVYYRLLCSVYAAGTTASALSITTGSIRGACRVTGFTSATVVDVEVLKDFGATTATTDWEEGQWSDYRGWPSAVGFDGGRLWWGGKDAIVGSVSDAFSSFDPETVGDSGPINRTLPGGQVDTINWILSLQRLMVGGQGAEFSCRSDSLDGPLTPTNFNPKKASTQGSAAVRALTIDSQGVYVQRGGTRVYTLAMTSNQVTFDYTAQNLCEIIPEIGKPAIVRIAVQRQPDTRIHCVRSDGTVALLIFDTTEQVTCWVDVETDGDVEDVAILPGDDGDSEDHVYYVVNRTINGSTVRYLERWAFQSECLGTTTNNLGDSFVTYSGASTTTITAAHLAGENVVVWADGADVGTASDGTQAYTLNGSGQATLASAVTSYMVGLPYTASFKSGKLLSLSSSMVTPLNQSKAIRSLGLIMADVHPKGLKVGRDLTNMDDLPELEDGYAISTTAIRTAYDGDSIVLPGTWGTDERLCLFGSAPRPVTILSAVMEIET